MSPRRACAFALLVVAACTAYTPESLEPAPAPLPSRLLPLHVGPGEAQLVHFEGVAPLAIYTDFATVFRRDLEANVFMPDERRWGYAEFHLTFDDDRITGLGIVLGGLNAVTLFVPALLGAPVTVRERTLQAEIVLYNARRVSVAKYVITGQHTYTVSAYKRQASRRAGIEAAKTIMEQFRAQLAPHAAALNARLRETGPVS
ncbi:MAG: hypothetical protein KatS3mg081_2208 [Gemmatimonadales bacterium]|nr:MAG: hypothetical protein KatS3mg081_2208 [Gemmatimonadales bacterium]